jgi:hypothetical protein
MNPSFHRIVFAFILTCSLGLQSSTWTTTARAASVAQTTSSVLTTFFDRLQASEIVCPKNPDGAKLDSSFRCARYKYKLEAFQSDAILFFRALDARVSEDWRSVEIRPGQVISQAVFQLRGGRFVVLTYVPDSTGFQGMIIASE